MNKLADLSKEELERARAMARRVELLAAQLNADAERLAAELGLPTEGDDDAGRTG